MEESYNGWVRTKIEYHLPVFVNKRTGEIALEEQDSYLRDPTKDERKELATKPELKKQIKQ